ncbi:MAG: MBL fold metallo-hydrolase [Ruminococcaceae bacterium]|nr:MBL fold metallo-hydrolase [Oscillospiraceae bacterium]
MKIAVFEQGSIGTNCYIVYDENSKMAFCVDCSDKMNDKYISFIEEKNLQICYLLITHGHYDHAADIESFLHHFPKVKVVISQSDYNNIEQGRNVFCQKESFPEPDILVDDADTLPFLQSIIQVIATPGHTSGSVCYLFGDALFCGDTVFDGSIGRTDMATGSFFEIMKSVAKIATLGDYALYPGHMTVTDIPTQRLVNPYFR